MCRLQVNGKQAKCKKRKVIDKVAEYKNIPRHLHIIAFEQCDILWTKELNSEPLLCVSFVKEI